MSSQSRTRRLRDYTNTSLEIVIAVLTFAPIPLLIYFYPTLPSRIPVFLNFRGEVEVSATKGVVSVFRVPLMAIDLQLICLLMKYGTAHYKPMSLAGPEVYLNRLTTLSVGMWDWFRASIAVKMIAESISILFMGNRDMSFLETTAWAVTWIATIVGVGGALVYAYRLLVVKREMKKAAGDAPVVRLIDKSHVYGGIFYYNPADSAVFVDKYALNFGNLWSYALLVCAVAYPMLVFSA
ncbi:MAG: hypothetical protein QOJ64_3721 [Acidobacteriota bacterium]|jgi:uncharacterized membrane protein|nr:hypothetical protein [Acidobacteriota bacterium]